MSLDERLEQLHDELLYSIVRVRSKDAGGSGTIIYSEEIDNTGDYETYILTNEHVIHSLYDWDERPNPLTGKMELIESRSLGRVDMFEYEDLSTMVATSGHRAVLMAYNEEEDLALLKLQSKKKFENIATLYPRGKEEDIKLFEDVYAVGCSLGHPTTFTRGQITGKSDEIDDKIYWMSNSQTIFGNSGGAMFIERDGKFQFIGVPSRVSVVGFRSAVSFMGYFIPPDRVYDFLENQMFQFIYDDKFTSEDCERMRKLKRDKKKELLEDLLNREFEEGV